jgi:hypothetical protein
MSDISITYVFGDHTFIIEKVAKWPLDAFGDFVNITAQNSDGTTVNLTGITPKLNLLRPSPYGLKLDFEVECEVTDAANGKCRYKVKNGDFSVKRLYYSRLALHTGTTKKEISDDVIFEVV